MRLGPLSGAVQLKACRERCEKDHGAVPVARSRRAQATGHDSQSFRSAQRVQERTLRDRTVVCDHQRWPSSVHLVSSVPIKPHWGWHCWLAQQCGAVTGSGRWINRSNADRRVAGDLCSASHCWTSQQCHPPDMRLGSRRCIRVGRGDRATARKIERAGGGRATIRPEQFAVHVRSPCRGHRHPCRDTA